MNEVSIVNTTLVYISEFKTLRNMLYSNQLWHKEHTNLHEGQLLKTYKSV